MLIVTFHNDGTGTAEVGNYDVMVRVNLQVLWEGRIERHRRRDGWKALLRQLCKEVEEA